MYHCTEHGIDHRQFDCPMCVAERRHDEVIDALKAQAEALEESQNRRANPGDYSCPHCLYTTLLRHATRCPKCHGTIDGSHWDRVRRAEEEAAKRRKEEEERRRIEWERTRPERESIVVPGFQTRQ